MPGGRERGTEGALTRDIADTKWRRERVQKRRISGLIPTSYYYTSTHSELIRGFAASLPRLLPADRGISSRLIARGQVVKGC